MATITTARASKITAATAGMKRPHTAKTKTAETIEADRPDDSAAYADQFAEMFGEFKIPSGRRMLVSVITQLFIIGTGFYGGMQVGAVLAVLAIVATGSVFLAYMAAFMAMALSLYASLISAARVGRYIALGEIDGDIARAKSWVGDKLSALRSRFGEVSHA